MKASDVVRPLIIADAYAPELAQPALLEAFNYMRECANVPNPVPGGHTDVFNAQAGVMIGAFKNPQNVLPNVFSIVRSIEERIGMACEPTKSSVRIQRPVTDWPRLKWHQDGAGMEIKEGQNAIVAWVPLEEIDGSRPSIEICDLGIGHPVPHSRDERNFMYTDSIPEDAPSYPIVLPLGGAVFFSPNTVHRTYFSPEMTKARISMDLRFYG